MNVWVDVSSKNNIIIRDVRRGKIPKHEYISSILELFEHYKCSILSFMFPFINKATTTPKLNGQLWWKWDIYIICFLHFDKCLKLLLGCKTINDRLYKGLVEVVFKSLSDKPYDKESQYNNGQHEERCWISYFIYWTLHHSSNKVSKVTNKQGNIQYLKRNR